MLFSRWGVELQRMQCLWGRQALRERGGVYSSSTSLCNNMSWMKFACAMHKMITIQRREEAGLRMKGRMFLTQYTQSVISDGG